LKEKQRKMEEMMTMVMNSRNEIRSSSIPPPIRQPMTTSIPIPVTMTLPMPTDNKYIAPRNNSVTPPVVTHVKVFPDRKNMFKYPKRCLFFPNCRGKDSCKYLHPGDDKYEECVVPKDTVVPVPQPSPTTSPTRSNDSNWRKSPERTHEEA
jgi:hypothetical protein